jgi:GNAT superfamily N-acetyltransferase
MTGPGAGQPIRVRRAAPGDHRALTGMFERCTLATRYRRFHAPVRAIPERYLTEALSGRPFHYALVAYQDPVPFRSADPGPDGMARAPGAPAGAVVALASCRLVGEGAGELGVLIEDAWQRRGLGTRLVHELAAHAADAGVRVLEAQLLAEQAWITGMLRPYGSCRLSSTWDGVLNVTVRLAR